MSNIAKSESGASPYISELHRAAVEYIELGFPVFPVVPGGKEPLCEGGFKSATIDRATVDAWWTTWPKANIGSEPERSGYCVLDVEADGLDDWAMLQGQHGTVRTFTNSTPRGGRHLWFSGSLPPRVRLWKEEGYAIDTRGQGSYVLLPPSIVNGVPYETMDDCDVADLPSWIAARAAQRNHDRQEAPEGFEVDLPENIRRAENWLREQPTPIHGARNDATFKAACKLKDLGLSPQRALDMLLQWAPIADDFTEDEVYGRVVSAFENGQNAPGCYAVEPSGEAFAKIAANIAAANQHQPAIKHEKPSPFRVTFESEMDNEPPIEWLIPDVLQRRSTMMIVGMKQSYKSFLALDMALAVATGRETFGVRPTRSGPTLYAALEGRRGIKTDRRRAWRLARGIQGEIPFGVCTAPHVASKTECNEFIDRVREAFPTGLELIVLETANKMLLGLDENSAKDAALLTNLMDELVEHLGCAVVVIHHKSDKANAAEVRGSSAFEANVDQVMQIDADRTAVTLTARITKMKDGEPRELPWHFRGRQSGPSMALDLLSAAEHAEARKGADHYAPKSVGAALVRLKAHGIEAAKSTTVLAAELFPADDTEKVDDRERRLRAAEKQLNRLAKGKLEGYCEKNSRGHLVWFLPN